MVELACAASLTPAYFPNLLPHLLSDWSPDSNIVLVVCGGSKVNARSLVMWQEEEEKGQGQGQGGKGEEGEGSGSAQGGRVSLEAEINGRRI